MKPVIALTLLAGLLAAQSSSAASLSKSDVKYVTKAAQGFMSELKLGALAQERADDQGVKDFGKQMVTDHGKDMEELKGVAVQKHVQLQQTMNQEQRKEAEKLSKLSGKEFDREYVKYEVKDHREDIKDQKEQIKKTSDSELKQFASKELETVTGHKQKIDALQARIK
jgi:putative membrane protein